MRESYRPAIVTLAALLSSGNPPRGEACFDAGTLLNNLLNEPRLFGVSIQRADGNGSDFLAVLARTEDEAIELAKSTSTNPGDIVEHVSDLESVIDDQYEGVAVLSTGGF